ncbi:MAG: hypothetical protein GXP33_08645 [Spirochaetes bacterium]|nr:hypothetical protein [Spirochaetota bacterium]
MTSGDRMLSAMNYGKVDFISYCFMILFNLYNKCKSEGEFVLRQAEMVNLKSELTNWL